MRLIRTVLLSLVCFALGSFTTNSKWKEASNGFSTLSFNPELVAEILQNSDANMVNDGCFPEKAGGADFKVSDYLLEYFEHFSKPDRDKYSGMAECGFIDENVCELSFGERNVEGDKGVGRHLRFKVDSNSGKILSETFKCWG